MLVIPVFIPHRGCPHDCLFCNQHRITSATEDHATPAGIAKIADEWLARSKDHDEAQLAFYGGSFTCLGIDEQVNLLGAVAPYLASGRIGAIRLSTRPDCVDAGLCQMLRDFGVGVVELGVQSLTGRVLAATNRGHSAVHSRNAFQLLKKAGMTVGLQLMPGLPGETTGSFLQVIDEVITLHPDFVRLYPALVIEGSGLAELYRGGGYQPLSLEKAVLLAARCAQKLEQAGIPVVRMGLQPSASLAGSVIAGPYHPSFGELVRSRLWLARLRRRLAGLGPGQHLEIRVSHREVSAVVGIRKRNIKRLEELGFGKRLTITADPNQPKGNIEYVVC